MRDIILIRVEKRWIKIAERELILLEASRNYIKVFTTSAKIPFLVRGKLDDAENLLVPENFCRVHRGYIIGLHHITDISENDVINIGIKNIPLTRNYAETFFSRCKLLGLLPGIES